MRKSMSTWGWATLLVVAVAVAFSGCGEKVTDPSKQEPVAKPVEQAKPAEAASEAKPAEEAKPADAGSDAKPAGEKVETAEKEEEESFDSGGDDDFDAFDYSAGGGSRSGKAK